MLFGRPHSTRPGRAFVRAVLLAVALVTGDAGAARAERLPIKTYGPAEGLQSTFVEHVTRDSRGFLWFSTRDGLSRFDGSRFLTYGEGHGLSAPTINWLLEARDGTYWIATNGGGVAQMNPAAALSSGTSFATANRDRAASARGSAARNGALFHIYQVASDVLSNRVNSLYEDREGRIWAATDGGLYRLDRRAGETPRFERVLLGLRSETPPTEGIHVVTQDRDGTLWIGCGWGLVRYTRDGRRTHFRLRPTIRGDNVQAILIDADGRFWIGYQAGLIVWRPGGDLDGTRDGDTRVIDLLERRTPLPLPRDAPLPLPAQPGDVVWFDLNPGGFEVAVRSLGRFDGGPLWMGTTAGLIEIDRGHTRHYTTAHGLPDNTITSLAADSAGNVWAATMAAGVMKLTRRGFRSFTEADGLGDPRIHAIFEDATGAIAAVSGDWIINRFDGRRFTHAQPRLETDVMYPWASQVAFLARDQRWWVLTNKDLRVYAAGARPEQIAGRLPVKTYADLPSARLYETRAGDIWIARRANAIARWRRAASGADARGAIESFDGPRGFPPLMVTVLAEDRAGNVWAGGSRGDLVRYHKGRFDRYPPATFGRGGAPGDDAAVAAGAIAITSLWMDDAGTLWAGSTRDGLIRIDETDADRPRFRTYSRADGLSSNNVRSVVSDRHGRVYAGTAGGIDRLDPGTGRIQHYTTVDGLASGFVTAAFRDSRGDLWFGTMRGLSQLTPEPGEPGTPPQVLIGGISVAGSPVDVAHLGQAVVRDVVLPPARRQLQVDFFGLAFGMGEALRYRYRLEGLDREWSPLSEERTVRYSGLTPRDYRFVVQAMSADGTESAAPAVVQLSVVPGLWERRWFQALVIVAIALAGYVLYRIRLARLLALERVRTHIASDLHDDIGATLAQIAVLSEVVQSQIDEPHAALRAPLARMAHASRDAISSMSDIVWAINPQKDSLRAMVLRIREVANEVLPPRGMTFDLHAPEIDLPLTAAVRRQVYLILKEALNNAMRHSGATHVTIGLAPERGSLILRVEDNGRGFDVAAAADEGNGLASMRRRAESLGGSLTVTSTTGANGASRPRVPDRGGELAGDPGAPGLTGTRITAIIPTGRWAGRRSATHMFR